MNKKVIVIEGNFVPIGVKKVDEAGAIKCLIDQYNYASLDFKFMGDTRVFHQRFLETNGQLPTTGNCPIN